MAGGSEDFPTDRPSESSLLRKSCFRKTPEPLQKTKINQKGKERERGGEKTAVKKSQTPALRVMLMQAVGPQGWSGSRSAVPSAVALGMNPLSLPRHSGMC